MLFWGPLSRGTGACNEAGVDDREDNKGGGWGTPKAIQMSHCRPHLGFAVVAIFFAGLVPWASVPQWIAKPALLAGAAWGVGGHTGEKSWLVDTTA